VVREDVSYDRFVDVLLRNTVYIQTLTVINKIDLVDNARLWEIQESTDFVFFPISADNDINLEELKERIFEKLDLIRVYMRPKGMKPDFEEPLVIRKGSSVRDIADKIHGELKHTLRFTRIWGKSVKYRGQKVSLSHQPVDEDILTFY
jgi:ribosome-interacting GTPase 1